MQSSVKKCNLWDIQERWLVQGNMRWIIWHLQTHSIARLSPSTPCTMMYLKAHSALGGLHSDPTRYFLLELSAIHLKCANTLNFHQILTWHLNIHSTSLSFSTGHNAAISVTLLDCALHCMYHPNKRGWFFSFMLDPERIPDCYRPQNITYLTQSSTAKYLLLQFLLLFSSFISTWLKTSLGVMIAHQGTATVPCFQLWRPLFQPR